MYIAKTKEAAVYSIINPQKRHVTNPDVFNKMDINWSAVKTLTVKELWKIETGRPIKLINTNHKFEEPLPCYVHKLIT